MKLLQSLLPGMLLMSVGLVAMDRDQSGPGAGAGAALSINAATNATSVAAARPEPIPAPAAMAVAAAAAAATAGSAAMAVGELDGLRVRASSAGKHSGAAAAAAGAKAGDVKDRNLPFRNVFTAARGQLANKESEINRALKGTSLTSKKAGKLLDQAEVTVADLAKDDEVLKVMQDGERIADQLMEWWPRAQKVGDKVMNNKEAAKLGKSLMKLHPALQTAMPMILARAEQAKKDKEAKDKQDALELQLKRQHEVMLAAMNRPLCCPANGCCAVQ